jgi:hypothetical protein
MVVGLLALVKTRSNFLWAKRAGAVAAAGFLGRAKMLRYCKTLIEWWAHKAWQLYAKSNYYRVPPSIRVTLNSNVFF